MVTLNPPCEAAWGQRPVRVELLFHPSHHLKRRAEIVERSFAHNLDRGGMRRTWLRGRENVHKRYLLHVAGHNLSLLMRQLIGAGTPREAVAGGYGCIFVIIAPAGTILVAQILLIVSQEGKTAFAAIWIAVE